MTHAGYERLEVVAYYEKHDALHESERSLFDGYLKPGMAILDVGVGAGRTTPHLAQLASRYVGVDLSDHMISRCRERFPELSFLVQDATRLEAFPDQSFDAVVFSFNGIDTIPTAEGRRRSLGEIARVLRAGGVFLFSSHNARQLAFPPMLRDLAPSASSWRLFYAFLHTLMLVLLRLPSVAFWRGEGVVLDPPTRGSPRIYVATPEAVAAELRSVGLRLLRAIPGPDPGQRRSFAIAWYEYASVKDPDPREVEA